MRQFDCGRPARLAVVAGATAALLAACGSGGSSSAATSGAAATPPPTTAAIATSPPTAPPPAATPAPLAPAVSDYHGIPELAVQMRFVAPTIGVDIPLYAVGLTRAGAMDAPEGPANSPTWQQGFWYRGGVEPGQLGTATVAGHLDDILGRPGAFWNIRKLKVGDVIGVLDQRNGATIRFRITETDVYTDAVVNTTATLDRLFGVDAVNGRAPGTTADTVARLVLITCTGTFTHGQYDHRDVVYAERTP